MNTTVDDVPNSLVALQFHGDPCVTARLDHRDGSLTWTTETAHDVEAQGEFAVVDGMLLSTYRHEGATWFRADGRTDRLDEVTFRLEEGLSAVELVIERGADVRRLRVADDRAAASFVATLIGDAARVTLDDELALETELDQPTLFG